MAKSCLTLCDPMDCSPPGFSVHGILQARTLEWVAIPFCRGSSRPSGRTQVSCIGKADSSPSEPPGKPSEMEVRVILKPSQGSSTHCLCNILFDGPECLGPSPEPRKGVPWRLEYPGSFCGWWGASKKPALHRCLLSLPKSPNDFSKDQEDEGAGQVSRQVGKTAWIGTFFLSDLSEMCLWLPAFCSLWVQPTQSC